jgi:uncharacterized protein (TIGR02266 family)
MTVRYKSATIDEFIEHHSHDVSRGGMYIKTPSPFPPGTLLKFEVRIAEEKKVMQGVGRVVWKRDASGASPDAPAGMGVKFIKLDDESKAVIDRLIGTRGSKDGAYDVGERASQPSSEPTAQAIKVPRKGTMIGLGAVTPEGPARAAAPTPEAPEPEEKPSEGFFPSGGPAEQPPPEDRTVMRQAAELLRDALIEAGGSMEEIGSTGTAPVVAAPNESADTAKHVSVVPPAASDRPKTTEKVASASVAKDAQSTRPAPSEKSGASKPSSGRVEQRPLPSSVPASAQKGGNKPALMLLGVAAIGGGLFWLTHQSKPAEPTPPQAEPAAVVAPPAPEPIASTEPPAVASAEPPAVPAASAPPVEETPAEKAARIKAEAAAKKAEEEATKKAADEQKKAAEDAKKAEAAAKKAEEAAAKKAADEQKKAELEAKKAAAAAAAAAAPKPPAPKPKPPAPKPAPPVADTPPSEVPPPPSPPAEKPPEAVKPSAPTPAPAPEPAPAPKDPPKEAPPAPPKAPESDNPY